MLCKKNKLFLSLLFTLNICFVNAVELNLFSVPLITEGYNLDLFLQKIEDLDWNSSEYFDLSYCIHCAKSEKKTVAYDVLEGALESSETILKNNSEHESYELLCELLDNFYHNFSHELIVIDELPDFIDENDVSNALDCELNSVVTTATRNPALDDRIAFVNIVMDNQGEIKFRELTANGTNAVSMQAPALLTSDYTLTLPSSAGSSSQVLQTNGSGVLSWVGAASIPNVILNGGNTTGAAVTIGTNDNFALNLETNNTNRLVISNTGTVTIPNLSSTGVVHNNASGLLTTSLVSNADIIPAAGIVDTKLATISTAGKVANSATTATSANTASAIVARNASGDFNARHITLENQGQLRLREATGNGTNVINFQAPAALGTDYTLTLPTTAGTANQLLQTNGSGVLAWATAALNGGNTLGAALTIGTNDAQTLNLETNGVTRLSISSSGNTTYQSNYRASAYLSTNTSPGSATATVVFDTENFDSNGNYNTGTGVYTVPVTGIYWVFARVSYAAASTGNRTLQIVVNGTPVNGYGEQTNLNGFFGAYTDAALSAGGLISLTAGNTLRIDFTGDAADTWLANFTNFHVHLMSV